MRSGYYFKLDDKWHWHGAVLNETSVQLSNIAGLFYYSKIRNEWFIALLLTIVNSEEEYVLIKSWNRTHLSPEDLFIVELMFP